MTDEVSPRASARRLPTCCERELSISLELAICGGKVNITCFVYERKHKLQLAWKDITTVQSADSAVKFTIKDGQRREYN